MHRDRQPYAEGPQGYAGRGRGSADGWVLRVPPELQPLGPPGHGLLQVQRLLRQEQGLHQPQGALQQVPSAPWELRDRPLDLPPRPGRRLPLEGLHGEAQQCLGNVMGFEPWNLGNKFKVTNILTLECNICM